jgi:hypothetical protein
VLSEYQIVEKIQMPPSNYTIPGLTKKIKLYYTWSKNISHVSTHSLMYQLLITYTFDASCLLLW